MLIVKARVSVMSFRTDLQTEIRESTERGLVGRMDALSEKVMGMLSIITLKSNKTRERFVEIQALKLTQV